MSDLYRKISRLLEDGESFILATVISHAGSTPRAAGAKMIVCPDGKSFGTIGGGLLEAEAINAAAETFRTGGARVHHYDLNVDATADSIDAICGGQMAVLLEFVESNDSNRDFYRTLNRELQKGKKISLVALLAAKDSEVTSAKRCLVQDDGSMSGEIPCSPSVKEQLIKASQKERQAELICIDNQRFLVEPVFIPATVFLFGAGHVSQQVAVLTRMVDFRTMVLDDRVEFANAERFEIADEIRVLRDFEHGFEGLDIDRDSYLVIVTRGHSHDQTVLSQALRTQAGYIGMIGSKQKRNTIYKALLDEGFSEEDLNRVHSPIGLSIGAESPQEIAVSIVAELIAVRAEIIKDSRK